MKYEKAGKGTKSGREYYDLDKAPEPLREMIKAKIAAAKAAKEAPGASKIAPLDDFPLQGNPGLISLLKWLIKISPPPGPRERGPAEVQPDAEGPEELSGTPPEPARPDPIEPSSSAWIIWLTIIALAAFYFFRAQN